MSVETQIHYPRDVGVLQKFTYGGGCRHHLESFGGGRRCECGTVLSRYNPGDRCASCESDRPRLHGHLSGDRVAAGIARLEAVKAAKR